VASVDPNLYVQTLSRAESLAHSIADMLTDYSDFPEPEPWHLEQVCLWHQQLEELCCRVAEQEFQFTPVGGEE
jgi:hypothetical protein